MAEMSWREAIEKVLGQQAEPLHYTEIAEAVVEQQLRSEFGATPAATVNSIISVSISADGVESPFIRAGRGLYTLRSRVERPLAIPTAISEDETEEAGLINALGMYWARTNVLWTTSPKLLGEQQPGSTPVDFCGQKGVYLLHDGRVVVCVGRTTEQPLGVRLKQHTVDRLNGRWDRFSWFGIRPVKETGMLGEVVTSSFGIEMLIVTMEALLIEGLEPPQNRKRGDEFKAVEFLQIPDPAIQKKRALNLIGELSDRLLKG